MGRARARWRLDLLALAIGCALALCPLTVAARGTPDAAAQRKINKAVTRHYLNMRFEAAEQLLFGVIRACKNKCRRATTATAWMYIGVVRGSGREDQASAREAFDAALRVDPDVALDEALATPAARATFQAARDALSGKDNSRATLLLGVGRAGNGVAAAEPASLNPVPLNSAPLNSAPMDAPEPHPAAAGLRCSPEQREVQTRRPVPVACRGDAEAARASLRYRQRGDPTWKSLDMKRSGESFRALIPCEDTMNAGIIDFFVVVMDSGGDPLDTLGSKSTPQHFIVDPNSQNAPAYEGEAPPARCAERVICPPDFPGCEDSLAEAVDDAPAKPYRADWLGIHFAPDIGFIHGSDVCATTNRDFECFASGGSPYPAELPAGVAGEAGELGDPYPGTGIRSGASGGTLRALLSYDHAFSERISLGARIGYAFGGAPISANGRRFLPVHAEGRVAYWLRSLSADGWHPYLHVGGGLAQVDIKKAGVTVRDCSAAPAHQAFLDCIGATNAYDSGNAPVLPQRTLDSYRRLGNVFGAAGGGVLVPLGGNAALQLNLNAMLMVPSVGFVLQPSIGLGYAL